MTIGEGAIGEFAIGESGRATYAEAGGGGTGATAAQIWGYQLLPGVTAGQMLIALYRLHGLDVSNPLTVSPTARTVATISQTIGTAGDVVTVTRTS